jgi:hypothetical protein
VVLEDADAERSVDPVQGGRVPDAWFPPEGRHGRLEVARLDAAAGPYTPDAVQSAERSSAALDFAAWVVALVATDAE